MVWPAQCFRFCSYMGLHCLPSHWVQSDSFGMEGHYLLPPPFPLHSFPTDPGNRPSLECNLLSPSALIPTRPPKWLQCSLWEGGLWQTLGVCGDWGQSCLWRKGWGRGVVGDWHCLLALGPWVFTTPRAGYDWVLHLVLGLLWVLKQYLPPTPLTLLPLTNKDDLVNTKSKSSPWLFMGF